MSLHRRNPRRDANEPAIVEALEAVGAKVKRLSAAGVADLLVLFRGRLFLLEVKTAKGRATLAQDETSADGWPVVTVRTEIAALLAIGATADRPLSRRMVEAIQDRKVAGESVPEIAEDFQLSRSVVRRVIGSK